MTSPIRIIHQARHHLVGLGFWQAWQMVAFCTDALVSDKQEFITIILAATSIGYIVITAACQLFPGALKAPAFLPTAAISMSAGTFALILASELIESPLFTVTFAIALLSVSAGNAMLLLAWGNLWSTLSAGRVGQHLYYSYAFAFIPFFIVVALGYPVGGYISCIFPIVSALILKSCSDEPRRKSNAFRYPIQPALLARCLGFIFILSLIWGASQKIAPGISSDSFVAFMTKSMVAAGIVLGALLLKFVVVPPESEPIALFRPIIPVMAIGIAACGILPASSSVIGNGFVTMGIYCLDMFIMLLATDIAFRTHMPPTLTFGIAVIVSRMGTSIGTLMANAVPFNILDMPQIATLCLVILVFSGMIVFTQADLKKIYETPYKPTPIKGYKNIAEAVSQQCRAVADSANLTTRETEVLELLVRGRTVQGICDELSIAQGTAKHHVSNIYRKLGVSDRRSVFDIVEHIDLDAEQ